jgi:hypothetical protein
MSSKKASRRRLKPPEEVSAPSRDDSPRSSSSLQVQLDHARKALIHQNERTKDTRTERDAAVRLAVDLRKNLNATNAAWATAVAAVEESRIATECAESDAATVGSAPPGLLRRGRDAQRQLLLAATAAATAATNLWDDAIAAAIQQNRLVMVSQAADRAELAAKLNLEAVQLRVVDSARESENEEIHT